MTALQCVRMKNVVETLCYCAFINHDRCTSDALNETDKSYETEGQEPGTVPELCIPVNGETDCPISVLRLIIWSTQIACGIKFLHKHKVRF